MLQLDCQQRLIDPSVIQSTSYPRQHFASAGSYLPGDTTSTKLLDIRGADKNVLTNSIIEHLRYRDDQQVSPYLEPVIRMALELAEDMDALFSISSWVMPDGLRTIRISLDLGNDHLPVIRLPNLDIRNGVLSKRIDIDLTPERLTLQPGHAQALNDNGHLIVSEPASHGRGLEIDFSNPNHPVIDAFMATADLFIGNESAAEQRELLEIAGRLTKAILPKAQDQKFRAAGEIRAINFGHGWQVSN